MELKTKVLAEEGKQEILITRAFDLPLDLLFKAYTEAELVEQWMSNKVLKLENKQHGGYRFEVTDPKGIIHGFHGTIHDFVENERITRTFEMERTPFPPQLEFLEFHSLGDQTSELKMHVIYQSVEVRDQILKLPFIQGINMAHNRLQEILNQNK